MSAPFTVLWLQSGGCGGCSMSLLCADTDDFHGQLRDAGIDLLWHPSLSLDSGSDSDEDDAALDEEDDEDDSDEDDEEARMLRAALLEEMTRRAGRSG